MDDRTTPSLVGIEPRVRTSEPAFEPLHARRPRPAAGHLRLPQARRGELSTRHLEPWGLASWHGRWYLTGHDLDRGAARVFRLGRIDSTVTPQGRPGAYDVPADHDARQMVDSTQVATRRAATAVAAGPRRAWQRSAAPRPRRATSWESPGDGRRRPATSGRRSTCDFRDVDRLADEVAGYGPDVVAVAPTDLTEAVVRRLAGSPDPASRPEEEL